MRIQDIRNAEVNVDDTVSSSFDLEGLENEIANRSLPGGVCLISSTFLVSC